MEIGGLVGYNYKSTIKNSYATGLLTGKNTIGGLVGLNTVVDGIIVNSYWDITTTGISTGGTGKLTPDVNYRLP